MSGLVFHLIPHTHWDREWYLPRAAFHARLVATMDDLLERLQADPAYRSFLLDGQTVLLEDYLRARPEREGDVKPLVKSGRLQIGPWYVLADELIPSGEALARNLLYGLADSERWGGRSEVLYSPDAFGHPAVWPTLGREFGLKFGVVWRGWGGEAGQELDLLRWRGPDGKDVLVWHLPPAGYEIGAALPVDRALLAAAWAEVRETLAGRALTKHVAVFVGADHHGARPDLPLLRDRLAEIEPRSAFRVSRLDEFFQATANDAGRAPVVDGELRWSYRYTWTLQGVHATRAPLKRANSRAELALERWAEPLAALARRYGGSDRRALLELGWRALLQSQFHDALAGTTSDAAAREVAERVQAAGTYAREAARGALLHLVRHDPDAARDAGSPATATPALVVWNPAPRPRGGVVIADVTFFRRDIPVGPAGGARAPRTGEGYRPFSLVGAEGRAIPVQVLDRVLTTERLDAVRHYPDQDEVDLVRVAFRAPAIPGLGTRLFTAGTPMGPDPGDAAVVQGRSIVNRWVGVTLEPTGALLVYDRRTGERFFDVLRLESGGDVGDTYTYCPPRRDRVVRSTGPIRVRRIAGGPLVAALEMRFGMRCGTAVAAGRRGHVAVTLTVMLHTDSPVVRCILDIDNQARDHRLRARLPTGLVGGVALAGAPFGSVARAPVVADAAEYPLETPVRTAPAQRFVVAAAGPRGIAVLAPGFFEYEWTPAGDLAVTLLRAVGELSRANLWSRPGHAAWPVPTPDAQCLGPQRVELALAPLTASDLERGDVVPALWEDVFVPPHATWLRDAVTLERAPVEVTLEGAGLVYSAMKPAQTGASLVLRCYNATDRQAGGAWRFGDAIKTAHRVRADERESVPVVLENRGRVVRFSAGPHELVTILVS